MSFTVATIVVLALAALFFWWLSSYDTNLTGENDTRDRARRAVRCGITLALVEFAFWGLWQYWRYNDRLAGFLFLGTMLPLSLIWASCVSELSARGFHWLIDPEDDREFDRKRGLRELDAIGDLVRSGRKEDAIKLCQMLRQTGDVSPLVLEVTLERLGVPQERVQKVNPLTEVHRLRLKGKSDEAETILKSLLSRNPSDASAALVLMQLYAQDMHRGDKAIEILRLLEQQPFVASAQIDFARRSIEEWINPKRKEF
jgi:hypothetical protein